MNELLWFTLGILCGPTITPIFAILLKILVNAWIAHKEGKQ